jgi:plasmid stability protein
VADLVVRNLDRTLIQALKKRAARRGRSAEAEHRAILQAALVRTRRKTLAQALASIPKVGRDEDFARKEDKRARNVLG